MTASQDTQSPVTGAGSAPARETWFYEEMDTRKRQYRVRSTIGQDSGGCGMVVVERVQSDDYARLIAAAPELLEALKAAREFIQPFDRAEELYDRIAAAIAKALGEQA